MTDNVDPLDELFGDSDIEPFVLKKMLTDKLKKYVELYRDGTILFTNEWEKLNLRGKLLAYLLARKALFLSKAIEAEAATLAEIENDTNLKSNSIRPTLGALSNERLIRKSDQDGSTAYQIPDSLVPKATI